MFSGIGGFEKGIEQSGVDMECIGYSEIDKYARSIYTRQFPKHKWWGDATTIDPKELPDFDLLVGGFPCQAFSNAGKRLGFDDTRGTLFFEIARVLREKTPKYFLLENVKGLLSHDKGRTFQTMLGILSELGYDVEWEVLNSKNFGVPQNRERIFIKGYFRTKCGGEILSKKRDSREVIAEMSWLPTSTRVAKFVDKNGIALTLTEGGHNCGRNQLITVNEGKAQAQKIYDADGVATTLCGNGGGQGGKTGLYKVGNVNPSKKGQGGNVYDSEGLSPSLCCGDNGGGRAKSVLCRVDDESEVKINKLGNVNPSGRSQSGDVYGDDGLAPTLTSTDSQHPLKVLTNTEKGYKEADVGAGVRLDHPTNLGRGRVHSDGTGALSTSSDWGTVDKDYRIRRLTPKECERLQGFPDDWTKYGKDGELISDTQRYKCCGNAVTVNVIEYLIRSMFG